MSESHFEMQVEFANVDLREKAIEFLNDEGPTFEEDVEELFRHLFPLQDDIECPIEIELRGDSGLYILFDVFGPDGYFRAQEYMEIFAKVGAIKIFGFFADDEQTELAWTIKGGKLITFYSFEVDEEVIELLEEFDEEEHFQKLIEFYESGMLKAK